MKRIIVCDDDAAIARAVSMKLSRAAFDVEVHGDGQAAWEAFERRRCDLFVTDYQMPRLDGLSLSRRVRAAGEAVPIILLTAKGYELDERDIVAELAPIRLMSKPFSPRELLAAAVEITGGHEAPVAEAS